MLNKDHIYKEKDHNSVHCSIGRRNSTSTDNIGGPYSIYVKGIALGGGDGKDKD